jgi:hypothetical protein
MPERTESLGHFEMFWDCPFCDTKKLLGKTHRHCPNCGAVQDETRRYLPPEGEEIAAVDHKFVGADRKCGSCGAPNSALSKNCCQCGAPLDGAAEVKKVVEPVAPPPRRRPIWPWLLAGLVVFCGLFYAMCLWKKTTAMQVSQHAWQRTVQVEELRDVQTSAWRDELPAGARGVACHRAQRSSRQVPDGEDCTVVRQDKQDGTYEKVKRCTTRYKSEGIDDDQCTYTESRWVTVDGPSRSGQGLMAEWPVVKLHSLAGLGQQREAGRTTTYKLDLKEPDGTVTTCEVSEAIWKKYADGAPITVEVGRVRGGVSCSSIQ